LDLAIRESWLKNEGEVKSEVVVIEVERYISIDKDTKIQLPTPSEPNRNRGVRGVPYLAHNIECEQCVSEGDSPD